MQNQGHKILRKGEECLKNAHIADWKTDAWLLYEYVTGLSRMDCLLSANEFLMDEEAKTKYNDMIEQRCNHIPLQQIIGSQEFMGYTFYINEHVLIPRMDTEVLVLEVEKYIRDGQCILDMCTGSGCIAVSLKKRHPDVEMTGVDCSVSALKIAEYNSKCLNAGVELYCSDLFELFEQTGMYKRFDIIVSNPPYIPSDIIDTLEPEVKEHEPRLALDGAEDGLVFYRKITRQCRPFLKKGGMLFFEIGHDQGLEVSRFMREAGFENVTVIKDLAGLDRVVYGGIGNV